MVGVQPQRFPIAHFRLGTPILEVQRSSQLVQRISVVGLEREGRAQARRGLGDAPKFAKNYPEMAVIRGSSTVRGNGALHQLRCLRKLSFLLSDLAEPVQSLSMGRITGENLAIDRIRFRSTTGLMVRKTCPQEFGNRHV